MQNYAYLLKICRGNAYFKASKYAYLLPLLTGFLSKNIIFYA